MEDPDDLTGNACLSALNSDDEDDPNIEVITTNFRAGKLDAAAIWEPTASKIVLGGIARRAASGEDFDALDGGFMVMLNDLIEQRPDVHRGWIEAELDAQLYMLDPANADDVASMAEAQTEQIGKEVLSLFGGWPAEQGGVTIQGLLDSETRGYYPPTDWRWKPSRSSLFGGRPSEQGGVTMQGLLEWRKW